MENGFAESTQVVSRVKSVLLGVRAAYEAVDTAAPQRKALFPRRTGAASFAAMWASVARKHRLASWWRGRPQNPRGPGTGLGPTTTGSWGGRRRAPAVTLGRELPPRRGPACREPGWEKRWNLSHVWYLPGVPGWLPRSDGLRTSGSTGPALGPGEEGGKPLLCVRAPATC